MAKRVIEITVLMIADTSHTRRKNLSGRHRSVHHQSVAMTDIGLPEARPVHLLKYTPGFALWAARPSSSDACFHR
jgi:hypothetical protein